MMPELGIRSSLLNWLDDRPPRLAFDAVDRRSALAWQKQARSAFQHCLGDAPKRVPLNPRILEEKQLDGYRRTMLTLDTAPHIKALCWLCIPDRLHNAHGKSPAMIATPGHGIGAKDLLAMNERGKKRREGAGYQKDYALQAVRLGYPTLVIEPLAFGERRDADHVKKKAPESPCHAAATIATMLGTTLARLRINDIQRGLDFLETVPEIDPARIGLMGISGGGQMTLWTCAVEPRIQLAIVSGYFNEFRASVMGMHHCICNFIPSLAREFDMTDLAAMVAPRPILIQSGTKDRIFPIPATKRAISKLRDIYKTFDVPERIDADVFNADHQWSPRKVGAFLHRFL